MSDTGVEMLQALEKPEPLMYHDQIGIPTIGVGHRLTPSELASGKVRIAGVGVEWASGLSAEDVQDLLAQDLIATEQAVTAAVGVAVTQPQFDALVSFTFNVGIEAFRHSTLLRLLNQGQFDAVPTQLRRWVYAKGVQLPVLATRRETEVGRWEALV